MGQEDIFIEVYTYVGTSPVIRWIRPVKIKRIKLLFDVWAWIIVSRTSDLDFTQVEDLDPEEFLIWAIFGAYASYLSTKHLKLRHGVEEIQRWVKGMPQDQRMKVGDAILRSREIGEQAQAYQAGMAAMAEDDGGTGSKKEGAGDRRS